MVRRSQPFSISARQKYNRNYKVKTKMISEVNITKHMAKMN